MAFLIVRLAAPLMALQGPRIDGEPQSLPIPTRSLLTGLFGSALGYSRRDHTRLQALQDNIRVAVIVHRAGVEISDYQIAGPLFIGRNSCPPASRIAGEIVEAASLEEATLEIARKRPGDIYLPAEDVTAAWGDLPLSVPGRRDWATYRHSGADLYVHRAAPRNSDV